MSVLQGTGWLAAALVCGVLSGCASTRYENTLHPDYGAAQHDADLAQCRKQNSTTVTSSGYNPVTQVKVDEDAAQACMTTLGWRKAQT